MVCDCETGVSGTNMPIKLLTSQLCTEGATVADVLPASASMTSDS